MEGRKSTPLRATRSPDPSEIETWVGWRIDDLNGGMLGHVEEVITDPSGSPAWLVIGEFRLGDGRRFLVPAYDAVGGGGRVWSPHERAQVRESARLVGGGTFTLQADRRLRAHYSSAPSQRRRSAA